MEQTQWADRRFNFDFPVTHWPVIIARLMGACPRMAALVKGVPSSILTFQQEGKWSVQQHIGHLTDLEELHLARINDFRAHKPILTAWEITNHKTETAGHNNKSIAAILEEFSATRNNFLEALLSFAEDDLKITALHPRLNTPMRVIDMAFFVAEHDDHHIAKIISLLQR